VPKPKMLEGDAALEPIARDAAVAINRAVGDLLLPRHIFTLFTSHEAAGRISGGYATAVRLLAMQVLVVNLYRLWEARTHLLCPWLFSDAALRELGMPPLEEFVSDWSALLTVRHQFAGHMLRNDPPKGKPGRILGAEGFGRALRAAGIWEAEAFLERVEREVIPGVERVRDELFRRWPAIRTYVSETYPRMVKQAAEGGKGGE
jgi:hypothetical protein